MVASTPLPNPSEWLPQDIETLTSSKDKATSRESSEQSSTIPDVDVLLSKSTSEIPINTNITLNTSSQPKVPTAVNTYSLAERPLSQLVTFFLSTESLKVPPSAISSPQLVIRVLTPDVQEPTLPLSDTLMMAAESESDSPQVPERPFPVSAEPPSVLLPEEEETKSPS